MGGYWTFIEEKEKKLTLLYLSDLTILLSNTELRERIQRWSYIKRKGHSYHEVSRPPHVDVLCKWPPCLIGKKTGWLSVTILPQLGSRWCQCWALPGAPSCSILCSLGHTWQSSGMIPGSVLRELCDAKNRAGIIQIRCLTWYYLSGFQKYAFYLPLSLSSPIQFIIRTVRTSSSTATLFRDCLYL